MNNYFRFFIIIQELNVQPSNSEKPLLSGYLKVESSSDKCKLSTYIQNLRPNGYYKLKILVKKDSQLLKLSLCDFEADGYGRIENTFEYDGNKVLLNDITAEHIVGATVEENGRIIGAGDVGFEPFTKLTDFKDVETIN